jgi:FtsP/CotA-like multicopper oxidase with cupredoxin domain
MKVSRRNLLKAGLVGGAAVLAPTVEFARLATRAGAGGERGAFRPSPHVDRFVEELRPPTPASSFLLPEQQWVRWEGVGDFVPTYSLTQSLVSLPILPGRPRTPVLAYGGSLPGPLFKLRRTTRRADGSIDRDGRIAVIQTNHTPPAATALASKTSTHLHGARVKGRYDGHPFFNTAANGQSFTHFYPNEQAAITMWYHDHNLMNTGLHVWNGLAAYYWVTDDHERALQAAHQLPADPYDIGLIIQDKVFNDDATVRYPLTKDADPVRQGAFGDVILVNGQPFPKLTVEPRKYRFRLLNGSNARFYNLRLSTRDGFSVVMTDGGLTPNRVDIDELHIAEAERYNIIVDFSKLAGKRVVLENTVDPDPFGDPVPPGSVSQIMAFDVTAPLNRDIADVTVPSQLSEWAPWYQDIRPVRSRTFRFERAGGQWVINGKPFDERRIDAEPVLNTTEIWEFVNNSGGWLHPVHAHLVEWRTLERNGGPIRPWEAGPKDVLSIGTGERVKFAIRFDGDDQWFDDADVRADPAAMTYPLHCHNLEHEDHDMMTQFDVKRR